MPLTDAERSKLIDDVVREQGPFSPIPSEDFVRWYVDRLARSLEAKTPTASNATIEANVVDVLTKTQVIVAGNTIVTKLQMSDAPRYAPPDPRRAEAIYGAIAFEPELAESTDAQYLDLVVRRRLRAVARMEDWVTAILGLFRYPDTTCPGFRINVNANPNWSSAAPHSTTLPRWTIKTQPASTFAAAVTPLWTGPIGTCEGNVVECGTAMSMVLLDSLLEVKDPEALYAALRARGPLYVSICNTVLADAAPNFARDTDARRVFTIEYGSFDDLQVGDYVRLVNHPMYTTFFPQGDFSGEHAVVTDRDSRDPMTGFKVAGHGVKPTTINDLRSTMLQINQTQLSILYAVGIPFLAYMQTAVTVPDVIMQQAPVDWDGVPTPAEVYRFSRTVEYTDFTQSPVGQKTLDAFVIVWVPSKESFGLHRQQTMQAALADVNSFVRVDRMPITAGPSEFDPAQWGVPFVDPISGQGDYWPISIRDNTALRQNLISAKDMPDPMLEGAPGQTGFWIVRPTTRPTPAGVF